MQGLFYNKTTDGKYTTLSLLRFYEESGYVIAKSVTGDSIAYFTRELKNFAMEGLEVKGEPEFTFCGAYIEGHDRISFKVENQVADATDTWVEKDILSFNGTYSNDELVLKQVSKRTQFEIERLYKRSTEEKILSEIS